MFNERRTGRWQEAEDTVMGAQGADICRLWLKREGERDFIPKPMES